MIKLLKQVISKGTDFQFKGSSKGDNVYTFKLNGINCELKFRARIYNGYVSVNVDCIAYKDNCWANIYSGDIINSGGSKGINDLDKLPKLFSMIEKKVDENKETVRKEIYAALDLDGLGL